jgi:iron complex transport system substrate-binding protein
LKSGVFWIELTCVPADKLPMPIRALVLALPIALAAAATLHAAPAKIVSLAPSLTQIVVELGAAGQLAAVTPFCQAPADIARLPGGIQPETEAVLALAPDLVLVTSMTPEATREQLVRTGLRVETIDAKSLPEIVAAMTQIAALVEAPAPEQNPPPTPASARTAALLFGAETGYSAGCGTHAHEILEAAGLRNIAAQAGGPWPQLGDEFLLAADPDIIVVADYGNADRRQVMDQFQSHPVRRHLSAVRAGRVVVVSAPAFSVPGPAALQAGEMLRAEVEKL